MDPVHGDRVFETTTSTGTGTINLAGAETGYRTFVAGIGDGEKCFYVIEAVDGDGAPTGDWEHGYGTVTDATPDTLSRDTIISSSNAGSAVNFGAGTKNVYASPGSRAFMEVGCRLHKTDNQNINNGAWTAVEWNVEDWDPFGMHEGVTNPERVTVAVPGRYEVKALTPWEDNTTGSRGIAIYKNGAFYTGLQRFDNQNNMGFLTEFVVHFSDEIELAANDYLEIRVYQTSGAGLNIQGSVASSSFCVRRVSS